MGLNTDPHLPKSQPSGSLAAHTAVEFAQQAEKLSLQTAENNEFPETVAVEAQFITPQDPVIVTADGNRLPPVPLEQAHKLNILKDEISSEFSKEAAGQHDDNAQVSPSAVAGFGPASHAEDKAAQKSSEVSLRRTMPPTNTHPLFPPLPLYGPPSLLRDMQCWTFRASSFFLSAGFLGVIVLGALFTSIPRACTKIWLRLTFRNPDARRPFYEEEVRRKNLRKEQARSWKRRKSQGQRTPDQERAQESEVYVPTEGGPDPVVCDVGYYARRVGLDVEEFEVQTEDGFIIDLWHVYDPREYTKLDDQERSYRGPELFTGDYRRRLRDPGQKRKFPVLLMHGLLQSSGAYCVNDDDSLAFYLCKSGYDVWLGNNRCGFHPKHTLLDYSDPRMWCWNIRQMGVFDLSALVSRVLFETGFEKIGLVCHSQGTTQTFVALAKEQRPELGEKLTVFCALAPAAYAGPLIGKMYFKFMRVISPALFRLMFGIHAFIPLMMTMHSILHPHIYGQLGYTVFSFLFDWTDTRWDRGLRDRMFQFAPVYVSSESMRWWLGRECFAKHKCILSTKEEWHSEDREDGTDGPLAETDSQRRDSGVANSAREHHRKPKGMTAWYNEQVCPFALWVAGNDDLVDGRKLLHRFEKGREPHVKLVHSKILPEYEHLDVIWAMDAVDQIFREIREVLWKTCNVRDECKIPSGCENIAAWIPEGVSMDNGNAELSSGDSA
ncbi:alpha/beta-hydrolase [Annulohypoxylon truncatum]|uniref:alpha/beta-hydrolase n=1 Tax=Annulohypoxylon truncatum TaxID=327061 RepID=UPI002007DABF|nr:alpha/beta-hydrolase [Annulohypoxylon truncatum]KAI1208099.1 alpha/beta-hydrolase [Annulohypoxylon truncatum]